MTDVGNRKEVYVWDGPPRISVSTEQVEHNGNRWLQHIVEGTEGGDGVVVVAVFDGRILLVKHFRPVTGATLVEFPRGFGGPPACCGTPEEHACVEGARELREETGVEGGTPRFLGYVWPDSGILGNKVAVVCVDVVSDRPTYDVDGEIDSMEWVSLQKMGELITSGQVCDGITLAAYALWCASK